VYLEGNAHVFGDDINTDYIISARRKEAHADTRELTPYLMEDIAPKFAESIQQGDFIVAGENFGCGSSREAAPVVIKEAGISAVLAKSYARIFFRNAINVGLPILQVDTEHISQDAHLQVDLEAGSVRIPGRDREEQAAPMPDFLLSILNDGGLIPHYQKHGGFGIEVNA
jgi:3-isopropylmalate/(R)-2-methylmalate dehydratase small subunit